MIRRCVWCPTPHVIGQVPPLDISDFTDGMCPAAAARENAKIDRLLTRAPGALFFGPWLSQKRCKSFSLPSLVEKAKEFSGLLVDVGVLFFIFAFGALDDMCHEIGALATFVLRRFTKTRR